MWVNKELFHQILEDNRAQQHQLTVADVRVSNLEKEKTLLREQKAKDDISIDWMRHRVNALEKQNAILLQKAAGVHLPVPEIVPTRPGSMTVEDFNPIQDFEDVGDDRAKELGLVHDDAGQVYDRTGVLLSK